MQANSQNRLEMLRLAPLNAWVALSEDESQIIAVARTYSEVVALSHKNGVHDPVILKTPSEWAPLSV
jgi:hypothetical protein